MQLLVLVKSSVLSEAFEEIKLNERNKKALLSLTGLCVLVVIGGFEPPTPAL